MTTKERLAPKIKSKKYLNHPIKGNFLITEGYIYNRAERAIHKQYFHKGIDYHQEFGSPVYAAASGYAVASYHRFPVLDRDYTFVLHENKPIGNGLGYFVQIYHSEDITGINGGRITQYGHLSRVSDDIKVKQTMPLEVNHIERLIRVNEARRERKLSNKELEAQLKKTREITQSYPWVIKYFGYSYSDKLTEKESYLYNPSELKQLFKQKDPFVSYVERGQIIGFIGNSALINGKPSYKEGLEFQMSEAKTWDECHLHFEEATRNWEKGNKRLQRDPYGVYKSVKHYVKPFPRSNIFLDITK